MSHLEIQSALRPVDRRLLDVFHKSIDLRHRLAFAQAARPQTKRSQQALPVVHGLQVQIAQIGIKVRVASKEAIVTRNDQFVYILDHYAFVLVHVVHEALVEGEYLEKLDLFGIQTVVELLKVTYQVFQMEEAFIVSSFNILGRISDDLKVFFFNVEPRNLPRVSN